ncbi:MAG: putative porin [Flavobacteriales bacterium]|jgi:hypothetical protein
MKIHALIACFVLFFGLSSLAQGLAVDTILPNTSFLSTVDSIEAFTQSSYATVPALGLQGGVYMDPFKVYRPSGGLIYPLSLSDQPLRFTALPLLGFAYAFGTQGSQHLKFSYAQAFKHGWLLNVHYTGHGANGFVRNNAWKQRDYRFDVAKLSERYQTKLSLEGLVDNRQFSGGIQIDSFAGSFPLPLLPVRKDSCSANVRIQRISMQQSFNFLKDSSRFFGLIHQSYLSSTKRLYAEQDTLAGLYNTIFFDSTSTLDRFELVSTLNRVGLSLSNKGFFVNAMLLGEYWRMRMAGFQHDTLELGFRSELNYQISSWKLGASVDHRLIGAFGSTRFELTAKGNIFKNQQLRVSCFQGSVAPDVYQRFYYGNTLHFQLATPELQRLIQVNTSLNGTLFGIDYELQVKGLSTQGVYQFQNQQWDASTENSSKRLIQGAVSLSKSFRGFSVSPNVRYLVMENPVFPSIITGASVGYNGFITKSKNLYLFSKVSYQFYNRYLPLSIVPMLSQVNLTPTGTVDNSYHNLSATIGFKVKTFRFFVSGANLGSLWMNSAQPLYEHLPIPSWQLQVGLVWEFWN